MQSKHHIMFDGVRVPANISLTAACLTALARARPVTREVQQSVSAAKSAAADYITSQVADLDDPFEVAIAAHALSVVNHEEVEKAVQRLKEIRRPSTSTGETDGCVHITLDIVKVQIYQSHDLRL